MAAARGIRHSRSVRSRTSKVVLAAGFAALLLLAIGLVQLTREARETPKASDRAMPASRQADAPVSRPAPGEPVSRAAPAAPRELHAATAPRAHTMPTRPPELAPPVSARREVKRDADGKLVPIIAVQDLRDRVPLSDAPMKACIERSGQRPTGTAMLNFMVGPQNNKVVIEATGVQDEETLAAYPDLLECMHRTASVLLPEGRSVPELGTSILIRRRVRIENGTLTENSIFNFSYTP